MRTRPVRFPLVAALVGALGLAGCGDDEGFGGASFEAPETSVSYEVELTGARARVRKEAEGMRVAGLLERQRELHTDGLALRGATPAATSSEQVLQATEAPEIPHEDFHGIGEVEATAEAATGTGLDSVLPESVVAGALVRIPQDLVRLRNLLEALLGLLGAIVTVWVVLQGHLAVGLFDFVLTGILGNPKQGVVVGHRVTQVVCPPYGCSIRVTRDDV